MNKLLKTAISCNVIIACFISVCVLYFYLAQCMSIFLHSSFYVLTIRMNLFLLVLLSLFVDWSGPGISGSGNQNAMPAISTHRTLISSKSWPSKDKVAWK